MNETKRNYRYLDSEDDRRALIAEFAQTRQELIRLVRTVPQDKWYEPRYHGWSPAALLGHLQLMDTLSRWYLQLAVMGIAPRVSRGARDGFNDLIARVFRQRVMETTLRGLEQGEKTVTDFILRLPMDAFSKMVYAPERDSYLTVEQALQEFFLMHWQDHLATVRKVDDMHYEPPFNSSVV
ncbi:MAG: DinB family protein [Anaerolineae bacterium]|nr:DinB family protein [Anaerolineae bacterium]